MPPKYDNFALLLVGFAMQLAKRFLKTAHVKRIAYHILSRLDSQMGFSTYILKNQHILLFTDW